MKRGYLFFMGMTWMMIFLSVRLNAQEERDDSKFSIGTDFYSNYIFRGTRYGQGPSLQPELTYNNGGLTIGIWGAFDFNGYSEADPYISYRLKSGSSFGVTDYYLPGLPVFEISDTAGSHALEINAGFERAGFSLAAYYIVNQAGGAGSAGGDKYFEAGYSFSDLRFFVGAGDGWHTSDRKFNVCNLGLEVTRQIDITEKFSVTASVEVILNPEKEELHFVVGFSF